VTKIDLRTETIKQLFYDQIRDITKKTCSSDRFSYEWGKKDGYDNLFDGRSGWLQGRLHDKPWRGRVHAV